MSLARLKVKVFLLLGEVYCCEDLTTYHAASIKQLMDRMRDIQAVRELPSILLSLKTTLGKTLAFMSVFFLNHIDNLFNKQTNAWLLVKRMLSKLGVSKFHMLKLNKT
ncbi:hypothetical protein DA717_05010 [Piscirickettsiaceae bacterium NZ-RLO2]|nr:hypothetical protein DA717_05010 [Piscirickettsiaceae bacterium NZ-RLO2]